MIRSVLFFLAICSTIVIVEKYVAKYRKSVDLLDWFKNPQQRSRTGIDA